MDQEYELHLNMQKKKIVHENKQIKFKKNLIMEKILILHNYIQNIGIQSHI